MPIASFLDPSVALGGLEPAAIDRLVQHGWCCQDAYLPEELTQALAAQCVALKEAGSLQPASVGRGDARQRRADIRTDEIEWLTSCHSNACARYLLMMDALRGALNVGLYLGLDEYESHFAHFSPGAFYGKHLDRFRDNDTRTISVVLYLNPDWLAGDGGALRLHPVDKASEDIAPLGSRLVLFLSADMQHEVMPAYRNRLSIAGWFRRRPMGA
jgi:SM-20-related protein